MYLRTVWKPYSCYNLINVNSVCNLNFAVYATWIWLCMPSGFRCVHTQRNPDCIHSQIQVAYIAKFKLRTLGHCYVFYV